MMYDEFVKGTNCKDNEYNYRVFLNLEAMYMNTAMLKEEIYEYGKKLVDNSKSEKELEIEAKIKAEIDEAKILIKEYSEKAKLYKELANSEIEASQKKYYKNESKHYSELAKVERNRLKFIKSFFMAA